MAGSEAPALRKLPGTATPIRLPLPRQSPTLPPSATDPKVLVLDEIGYLPLSREDASLLFRLVARRYEKASVILTSNKSFVDWGDIFSDAVLATAILDRLLHHSTTINIKGESYRLKTKRKAGMLSVAVKEEEGKAASG